MAAFVEFPAQHGRSTPFVPGQAGQPPPPIFREQIEASRTGMDANLPSNPMINFAVIVNWHFRA